MKSKILSLISISWMILLIATNHVISAAADEVSAEEEALVKDLLGDTDADDKTIDCFSSVSDKQLADNKVSTLSPTELSRVLIEGSHSFAFDLLKALHKFEPKDNSFGLLMSPSSIWSTLVITYLASNGETETELRNKLRLQSISKSSVGLAYQGLKLWNDLKKNMTKMSDSEKTILSQANRIFVNNDLQINPCFADYFDDDIRPMNFTTQPIQSTRYINGWVEELTNGKITDLIPNGSINPWTKMIIANAVYFHSKWLNEFTKDSTRNTTFFLSPTDEISVEMMSMESTIMYGISEKLQVTAIDLSYANPDYSMIIILPDVGKGLDSLIASITPADLYELVANMYDDEVAIQLPKFKVEQEFEMAGPLYSIGIKKLFDPRFANLSSLFAAAADNHVANGTNTTKSGHHHHRETGSGFALNSVIHKSYITVNEEGTEAAAATALIYGRSGRPVFTTQFIANRPFLYLIRDVATNFILFLGTVRRPQQ
ncbi:serpin B6-like [Oppia nitens]|uniref:serpin B6-like n=1 Tax=Oppia nitens TaxID=1686743 RepID=UPI0023DB5924|nr:serpin B6-like [Oppia nitens]